MSILDTFSQFYRPPQSSQRAPYAMAPPQTPWGTNPTRPGGMGFGSIPRLPRTAPSFQMPAYALPQNRPQSVMTNVLPGAEQLIGNTFSSLNRNDFMEDFLLNRQMNEVSNTGGNLMDIMASPLAQIGGAFLPRRASDILSRYGRSVAGRPQARADRAWRMLGDANSRGIARGKFADSYARYWDPMSPTNQHVAHQDYVSGLNAATSAYNAQTSRDQGQQRIDESLRRNRADEGLRNDRLSLDRDRFDNRKEEFETEQGHRSREFELRKQQQAWYEDKFKQDFALREKEYNARLKDARSKADRQQILQQKKIEAGIKKENLEAIKTLIGGINKIKDDKQRLEAQQAIGLVPSVAPDGAEYMPINSVLGTVSRAQRSANPMIAPQPQAAPQASMNRAPKQKLPAAYIQRINKLTPGQRQALIEKYKKQGVDLSSMLK